MKRADLTNIMVVRLRIPTPTSYLLLPILFNFY